MDPLTLWLLVIAPFLGSFLGTLVLRLPEGRPVILGRSACPSCGGLLGLRDLLPLLGWLLLRGRCRQCGAPIPAFYPGVEIAAFGVAAWAAAAGAAGAALVLSCLLGWALLALALIDRRRFLLPDALTLPLIPLGLGAAAWLDPAGLTDHALGAVLGYGVFLLVALAYRGLRGREGLGRGDAKLLAAGGAWVGWAGLPGVVLIASLLGIMEVLARRAAGERLGPADRIAYGAWLAAGIWIVWLHGPPLPPG